MARSPMKTSGPLEPTLSPLRGDLVLREMAPTSHGARSWQIYDPLQHRYFAIDHQSAELLRLREKSDSFPAWLIAASTHSDGGIARETLEAFERFLHHNRLVENGSLESTARGKPSDLQYIQQLLHQYLFFKVPLINPASLLNYTHRIGSLFVRRATWVAIALTLAVSLYLVGREWDQFASGIARIASLNNASTIIVVLFIVKLFHELGHAVIARHFGCRVSSMGIAFMLLAPLPYADVTDAWRLTDRRHRMAIDSAGMGAELLLAIVATLLWVVVPDGVLRQACLVIASISWIMSVGINLNPFMRFDGYYLLCDLTRIDNLQPRAFDLAVWHLRRTLLGLDISAPEPVTPFQRRAMITYAWLTWCYRLVLYLGIAAAVYTMFFKALGVALFLFEIIVFVLRPIARELWTWWQLRRQITRTWRGLIVPTAVVVTTISAFVPFSGRVSVPAIIESDRLARVYVRHGAELLRIHVAEGASVAEGATLFEFRAPQLENEMRNANAQRDAVEQRLRRIVADSDQRHEAIVLEQSRQSLLSRLAALKKDARDLTIRAPISGTLGNVATGLHIGRWLAPGEYLALIHGEGGLSLTGYAREADMARIAVGASARFIPEGATAEALDVELTAIATHASSTIDASELATMGGGPITGTRDKRSRFAPDHGVYLIRLKARDPAINIQRRTRGVVHIDARPESYASILWRAVLRVIVRESSA